MMEIKSWKNISTEGQSLWDMMTEKDKGTILAVITDASKTFQPRTQYPPRTANLHEFNIDTTNAQQYLACMHAIDGDMMSVNRVPPMTKHTDQCQAYVSRSSQGFSQGDHHTAAQLQVMKSQCKKAMVPASDPQKVMSNPYGKE